ncbi:HTH-type transcriptional repressor YvoA [Corynebacterium occultum]|uniref:HTH-type transcriptional repressor YvoA n=1 Tax=Corynebacterium occultum TaxID=2675219 RepID=A0A6B8W6L1_9CORY|nr:GntR family transcriptional regulator [Corynebacterium occultum]QGU06955.1 HTH-type transcriptional repressor YvoA [Corynebacterium occultum]
MVENELDSTSGVPLYRQIKEILRAEISSGQVNVTRPMTEAQLLERFGVSRAPIRQALRELTDEGYVYRKQGKGTFPIPGHRFDRSPNVPQGGLQAFLSDRGLEASSKVSTPSRAPAPTWLRQRLKLSGPDPLLHFTRLILVEGVPLADAEIFLRCPEDFNPTAKELRVTGSAFALLEKTYGVTLERAEHEAWATPATTAYATRLNVEPGSPLLAIETVFYTTGGVPSGWRIAMHKPDEFKYRFDTLIPPRT